MNDIKPRTVYLLRRTDKENDGTDLYVGSTSVNLKERLLNHKRCAIDNWTSKLYIKMQEIGVNNWQIVPLFTFLCDKKTIREFERKCVEVLIPNLNTYSPLSDNYEKRCRQSDRELYHRNIQNKTYYCNVCDKPFGQKVDLKRYFGSLNHSYAYLNSLD